MRLLMSFVPIFHIYVNFTLHDNSQGLYLFQKRELSVSTLNVAPSYDITQLSEPWHILEPWPGIHSRPSV